MKKLMRLLSNNPPARNTGELWQHFSDTYFSLRLGLGLLAITLPWVLWLAGKYCGLDLQRSMSAYFWAAGAEQCASFPMRTVFVGFLCAIGAGLYAYKGLTPLENSLLNVAGICAALVALFPKGLSADEVGVGGCAAVQSWAGQTHLPIHYAAAVTLFVLLAAVAGFCANKSLEYLPAERNPALFHRLYQIIALAMLFFPITGFVVAYMFGAASEKIFFVEAAGITTFAVYWFVKTLELSWSRLEKNPAEAVDFANQRAHAPGAGDKGGA